MKSESKYYVLFSFAIIIILLFVNKGGKVGLAAGGLIIFIYYILYKKDVALAFALCAVINANPAMMISGYSFGFPKQMPFLDVFFLLSFLVIFSPQIKERRVDFKLKNFLPIIFLFLLYQFFVSFLYRAAPDSPKDILRIMYRQWGMYLGVFLVIPSYVIFRHDDKKFLKGICIASIIFTLGILINLYTPIELFKIRTQYRNGAVRIFLFQSTLFYFTTLLAVAAFTFYKAKKKHTHIYLSGVLAMFLPVISMYRLEILTMVLTSLLTVFFVSKYLNRNLIGFVRLFKIFVGLFLVVIILAPEIYNAMADLYVKTFQELLGTGQVEKGTTQARTEHELPLHMSMIRQNPILGNGWDHRWWGNNTTSQDWGLTDLPLTSTLAMYGWLGLLIYYLRYFYFLPFSRQVLQAIGKQKEKIEKYGFYYIIVISLRAYFIGMITFRVFFIGYELTFTKIYADFGALLGIYFASIYMIESQDNKQLT